MQSFQTIEVEVLSTFQRFHIHTPEEQLLITGIVIQHMIHYESSPLYALEDYITLLHRFLPQLCKDFDGEEFIACLSSVYDFIIRLNVHDGPVDYVVLKQHLRENFPRYSVYLQMIRGDIMSYLLTGSMCALTSIARYCSILKRLNIYLPTEDSLVETYYQDEERLSHLEIDKLDPDISAMKSVVFDIFKDFTLSPDDRPRHGNGRTADITLNTISNKEKMLGRDMQLDFGMKDYNYGYLTEGSYEPFSRTSKLSFVPKSVGKLRSICFEPTTLQYYQQMVLSGIVRHISRSEMYIHVQLDNQELNRSMCDPRWVTIDLSRASDSVSWRLVREVFGGTPLLRMIYSTRSTHCRLPNGKTIQLHKCSPMGSALCFPIESILFYSMLETVRRQRNDPRLTACGLPTFAVYGDDIICPPEYVEQVFNLIEKCGFLINKDKTFTDLYYRETCGIETMDGNVISNLRLPRNFRFSLFSREIPATQFSMLQDFCNKLHYLGLSRTHRFLVQCVKDRMPPTLQPVFSNGQWNSYSWPLNTSLPKVYSKRYQKTYIVGCSVESHRCDDQKSYHQWLLLYSGRPSRSERCTSRNPGYSFVNILDYCMSGWRILRGFEMPREPRIANAGRSNLRLVTKRWSMEGCTN